MNRLIALAIILSTTSASAQTDKEARLAQLKQEQAIAKADLERGVPGAKDRLVTAETRIKKLQGLLR